MNALFGVWIASTLVYGYLYDPTFYIIYAILLVAYTVFIFKTKNARENPKRKTLMAATWNGKTFNLIL